MDDRILLVLILEPCAAGTPRPPSGGGSISTLLAISAIFTSADHGDSR
ncbi:MAG: hypothetical protein J2P13_00870 [Acidobacteria bacterium]|nr:hypothetical protein [Acidobacteriota bacterium]